MKKRVAKIKNDHREQQVKDELVRVKCLKWLRELIEEDWGNEPDFWNESDIRCEVYRALTVLERIYEIGKKK